MTDHATTRYNIILADPPWDYRNGGNGRARAHYPTMTITQILSLPVADLAAPHCVLLLWATWPQIAGAVDCIRAWGFEQVTGLPWVKIRRGEVSSPSHARAGSQSIRIKLLW